MMNSIRERLVLEIIRRLEANQFSTVSWSKVIRTEIPEDYDASHGSLLSVLEGREELGVNTSNRQNQLTLFLSFAIPLADREEPQGVANNAAAEIVKALHGNQAMEEGGEGSGGQVLAATFKAITVDPNLNEDMDNCGAATVEFDVQYRTQAHDLFTAA